MPKIVARTHAKSEVWGHTSCDRFIATSVSVSVSEQEGILHAHASIRWTTAAWAHQICGENRKLAKVSRFKSHFVGALNRALSYKKDSPWQKSDVFYTGFQLKIFQPGLLMTFKTQRQKIMFLYKSDFHLQSNAFVWFDFQTRGFAYQGRNAS